MTFRRGNLNVTPSSVISSRAIALQRANQRIRRRVGGPVAVEHLGSAATVLEVRLRLLEGAMIRVGANVCGRPRKWPTSWANASV